MAKIINNNLWSPVPWDWGCNRCNSGNNWLNNWLGYQMMFGLMNNMLGNLFAPQQRQQTRQVPQTYNPYGCFYPGLSLGATQGNTNPSYEEYMEKIQAQNDLAQLKQTWNEFKFSNIGGKFQAVLKADKSVILDGDTTDELMSNIIGYVNENPAQFKTKEKEGAGGVDETGAEAGAGADAVADTGNDTGDGNEGDGAVQHKVKPGWYVATKANNTNFKKAVTYNELSKEPDKAAGKATDALISAWGSFGGTVDRAKLKELLIKHNPSIFHENGKLKDGANMNLFDVPTTDWAKNNSLCRKNAQKATISNTGRYCKGELKLWTGYTCETNYIKWNNNNNMIYKCGKGYDADSDLVLLIDGNHYKINGEDFYKALGLRDDSFWSELAGGNSNIINPKTGQFKTDGTWPSEGFKLSCVKEGNNRTTNLKGSKLTVENNKVVLIVGTNRFLMDNVMNGTIPCNQINGNKNNRYAES